MGGSGLKHDTFRLSRPCYRCFSRPGGREWIETWTVDAALLPVRCVSPVLVGGSGLKQILKLFCHIKEVVSPVLVGGSGLKPVARGTFAGGRGFSRPGGREWIETSTTASRTTPSAVSPVLVGGSGLKRVFPRRAVARYGFSRPGGREWIETCPYCQI